MTSPHALSFDDLFARAGGGQRVYFVWSAEERALVAAVFSAFLHKTVRGQAAGGVRHWAYDTAGALITDGLRLSRGMGRKNALAGLWWGGGKGVIARAPEEHHLASGYRDRLYRAAAPAIRRRGRHAAW